MTGKTAEKEGISSNIWKIYTFSFIDAFILYLPFIVYYFQEIGFNLPKIMIMSAATTATVLLTEIPSGYIADRVGRRNSLVISVLCHVISMAFLYSSTSYSMLIIAHVFLGLASTFFSGADSALIYDTLAVLKREKEYSRFQGKAIFFSEMGIITSALAGSGLIALGTSIRSTILFTLAIHAALLLFMLTIKEPPRQKLIEPLPMRKEFSMLGRIVKESVSHRKLMGLFIYSFLVMGFSNTIFIIYQPYFRATDLPIGNFGIVFAVFSIVTAFAALKAHNMEKRLGIYYSLLIMPVLIILSYFGAGAFFLWFGFIFFFFREFVRGFVFPVLSDYTNRITSSERRATVLSISGMFSRLGYMIISVSFGFLSENTSLRYALITAGAVLTILTIIIVSLVKRPKTDEPLPRRKIGYPQP
ncbi:MAG: MFS transporter [Candidatus Woesearchaeota archaeon]